MKVYKVVKKYGDHYLSCVVKRKASTRYYIGEFAEAPKWLAKEGYYPLAFKFLEDAKEFNSYNCVKGRIFEAEAEGVDELCPPMLRICPLEYGSCTRFTIFPETREGGYWPSGTIMAKRIKLIEEVT